MEPTHQPIGISCKPKDTRDNLRFMIIEWLTSICTNLWKIVVNVHTILAKSCLAIFHIGMILWIWSNRQVITKLSWVPPPNNTSHASLSSIWRNVATTVKMITTALKSNKWSIFISREPNQRDSRNFYTKRKRTKNAGWSHECRATNWSSVRKKLHICGKPKNNKEKRPIIRNIEEFQWPTNSYILPKKYTERNTWVSPSCWRLPIEPSIPIGR